MVGYTISGTCRCNMDLDGWLQPLLVLTRSHKFLKRRDGESLADVEIGLPIGVYTSDIRPIWPIFLIYFVAQAR
jgi:hypothetical protein